MAHTGKESLFEQATLRLLSEFKSRILVALRHL